MGSIINVDNQYYIKVSVIINRFSVINYYWHQSTLVIYIAARTW
jgi:hypothetical protein